MGLSREGLNSSLIDLVELYDGMFIYQVSMGGATLILIVSINEVEL